jgi:hypothetical protein
MKIPAVGSSRARRLIPRATADAQYLAPRIWRNDPCTNFFAVPARIERLLEDQNSTQALYNGGLYSADAIYSDCWRCSNQLS